MITVRKLKLSIRESDEESRKAKYQFIRDAQRAQYRALNLAMGFLSSAYLKSNKDTKQESYKNAISSLKNTHPIFNDIEFGKGIDSKSLVNQKVKDDFRIARKNGLARGERNITSYKQTHPLMTKGRDLKFRYEGDDIVIRWVNKEEFNVNILIRLLDIIDKRGELIYIWYRNWWLNKNEEVQRLHFLLNR